MKPSQLLHSFDQAINWNAFLYGVYKFLTTLLTLILYSKLSTLYFSVYANVHSIIFILLLWLDCGFKKSIARFCPEYALNSTAHRNFIIRLLCFKAFVLICSVPLCRYILSYTAFGLPLAQEQHIMLLAVTVFAIEGMVSLLQLIYQAHFWHKYFSLISSAVLATQMIINCIAVYWSSSNTEIISIVLYSKIIGGFIISASSCSLLLWLYTRKTKSAKSADIDIQNTNCLFVKHSAIMWASNSIKSLTERNVMVPLLTHVLGPVQANIFKVANDSALFFYRIILKTIGSTDTALLSHAKIHHAGLENALGYLQKKITVLTGGLFVAFLIALAGKCHAQMDIAITQLSAFITICFLAEILFSPYERILEVELRYLTLFKAYAPYIVLVILLFASNLISTLGLFLTIVIIHIGRLMSAALVMLYAKKEYLKAHTPGENSAKSISL